MKGEYGMPSQPNPMLDFFPKFHFTHINKRIHKYHEIWKT